MQTKSLEGIELKAGRNMIFEGYSSLFNIKDSDDDIISQGAFKDSLRGEQRKRVKVLWQHDTKEPIGTPTELFEDSKGLYLKCKLSDTKMGKNVYQLIKDGVLTDLSIGFDTISDRYDKATNTRHILNVKLWEISAVTFGSCQGAVITDCKSRIKESWNDAFKSLPDRSLINAGFDKFKIVHDTDMAQKTRAIVATLGLKTNISANDVQVIFYRPETITESLKRIALNQDHDILTAPVDAVGFVNKWDCREIIYLRSDYCQNYKTLCKTLIHELGHLQLYREVPELRNTTQTTKMKELSEQYARAIEDLINVN